MTLWCKTRDFAPACFDGQGSAITVLSIPHFHITFLPEISASAGTEDLGAKEAGGEAF